MRFPLVQGIDGLDVVMLVHEQGGLPFVHDHLAEDDIRTAFRRILAGLETVLYEEPTDERRGLGLCFLVRGNRREATIFLERFQGLLRIRFHARKDVRQRHLTPLAIKSEGHKKPTRQGRARGPPPALSAYGGS
jgi:hypothetical protein